MREGKRYHTDVFYSSSLLPSLRKGKKKKEKIKWNPTKLKLELEKIEWKYRTKLCVKKIGYTGPRKRLDGVPPPPPCSSSSSFSKRFVILCIDDLASFRGFRSNKRAPKKRLKNTRAFELSRVSSPMGRKRESLSLSFSLSFYWLRLSSTCVIDTAFFFFFLERPNLYFDHSFNNMTEKSLSRLRCRLALNLARYFLSYFSLRLFSRHFSLVFWWEG